MSDATTSLLDVRDLRTHFKTPDGPARAVDGISFDIRRGECVALVGESGCGKSVTSLTLMRLLPGRSVTPSGRVLFEGRDLLTLSETEMCRVRGSSIGMIFQEPQSALNPVFPVGEQIAEAFTTHHPGASRTEARQKAIDALRQVGIPDPERRAADFPHQLSGGMKQRVCIAMALICSPKLLIADEPTTALDVTIQAQILSLLKSLQRERGLSLLLITHDLGVVAEMAERTCVMYAGKIVEQTPTADLFRRPLHPYTQGLLRARPGFTKAQRLAVIPGLVPPATRFQDNCRFNKRCPLCVSECVEKEPKLAEYGGEHHAACFRTKAEGIEAWATEVAR